MKKICALALVIAMLGLAGCWNAADEATKADITSMTTESTTEMTTTQESTTEEPIVPRERVFYPYTEFEAILQPGNRSANELAKHYGEPKSITGYCVANMGDCSGYELTAEFEGITFHLWDSGDSKLSYHADEYDGSPLVPTERDKDLQLEVYGFDVTGSNIALPRGIRIGDSRDKVREAYPDEPAEVYENENGEPDLFYRYYNKREEAEYLKGNWRSAPGLLEFPYGIYFHFSDGVLTKADLS